VLFDDDCGVCVACATWLARHGRDLTVEPIGSAASATLLRDLTPEAGLAGVHAIDRLGRRRTGGAAVPAILRTIPGAGLLARLTEALPGPTDRAYRAVARNRRTVSRLLGAHACAR
jgi:predicted DCC family thiol-disulfide oxidoreductase YuxK